MPSICLRGRRRGQQVWPVCLVRILLKGTQGRLVCYNVAWLYLVWVGVFVSTPTPDEVVHVHTPFFLHRLMCKGLKLLAWQYILDVGDGHMQCFHLTCHLMAGGIWLAPLPSTGSCTHVTSCLLKTKYSMLGGVACMTHLEWAGVLPVPPDWVMHVYAFIGLWEPDVTWRGLYQWPWQFQN